jgi:hypothetical protein
MIGTDVKATRLTATGQVTAANQRGRLRGVHWVGGASAGTLVFADGSGGTTRLTIDTPAGATLSGYMLLPDNGILFRTDIHCTVTNTAFVTCFWDG